MAFPGSNRSKTSIFLPRFKAWSIPLQYISVNQTAAFRRSQSLAYHKSWKQPERCRPSNEMLIKKEFCDLMSIVHLISRLYAKLTETSSTSLVTLCFISYVSPPQQEVSLTVIRHVCNQEANIPHLVSDWQLSQLRSGQPNEGVLCLDWANVGCKWETQPLLHVSQVRTRDYLAF